MPFIIRLIQNLEMSENLSVRELQSSDIELIAQYWADADGSFLRSIGVEMSKLPTKEIFMQNLQAQLNEPLEKKKSFCLVWLLDGKPIGHCNTNPTVFGEYAYMHLHIWNIDSRKKGMGEKLLQLTLPFFFDTLQLKTVYSEPYALNAAPNKTFKKVGFEYLRQYVTTPGTLNFQQPVKRWELTREEYKRKKK